jgi:hypothetical protein
MDGKSVVITTNDPDSFSMQLLLARFYLQNVQEEIA